MCRTSEIFVENFFFRLRSANFSGSGLLFSPLDQMRRKSSRTLLFNTLAQIHITNSRFTICITKVLHSKIFSENRPGPVNTVRPGPNHRYFKLIRNCEKMSKCVSTASSKDRKKVRSEMFEPVSLRKIS